MERERMMGECGFGSELLLPSLLFLLLPWLSFL